MRRAKLAVVVLLLAVPLAAPTAVAPAAGRAAPVVGNSTYAHIGRLPNPQNDAIDMAAALRRLGFDVTTELDTDREELTEALRGFTRRSAGADVSLVFYAGHGIEMDGVNYLVPVDARLARDTDMRFETVTLDDMLAVSAGGLAASRDPGRVPEQAARPIDAADGGAPEREREQLWGPERGTAGGRDAGGICGGGGDEGGGRAGPKQPVHVDAAVASGTAAGDRAVVPAGAGAGAGGDERGAAAARVPVAGERALPSAFRRPPRLSSVAATPAPAPDAAPVDVEQLDVAQVSPPRPGARLRRPAGRTP